MKALMIIMMFGASDGGRYTQTVNFASSALCETAKVEILAEKGWSQWKPVIVCVKTGY